MTTLDFEIAPSGLTVIVLLALPWAILIGALVAGWWGKRKGR